MECQTDAQINEKCQTGRRTLIDVNNGKHNQLGISHNIEKQSAKQKTEYIAPVWQFGIVMQNTKCRTQMSCLAVWHPPYRGATAELTKIAEMYSLVEISKDVA